jgi:hypothetical protein
VKPKVPAVVGKPERCLYPCDVDVTAGGRVPEAIAQVYG